MDSIILVKWMKVIIEIICLYIAERVEIRLYNILGKHCERTLCIKVTAYLVLCHLFYDIPFTTFELQDFQLLVREGWDWIPVGWLWTTGLTDSESRCAMPMENRRISTKEKKILSLERRIFPKILRVYFVTETSQLFYAVYFSPA